MSEYDEDYYEDDYYEEYNYEEEPDYEGELADMLYEEKVEESILRQAEEIKKGNIFLSSGTGWDFKKVVDRKIHIGHADRWHWVEEFTSPFNSHYTYCAIKNCDTGEIKTYGDEKYNDNNWEEGFEYPPLFHIGTLEKDECSKDVHPLLGVDTKTNTFKTWIEASDYYEEFQLNKITEAYEELQNNIINKKEYGKDFHIKSFLSSMDRLNDAIIYDDNKIVYSMRGYINDIASKETVEKIISNIRERKQNEDSEKIFDTYMWNELNTTKISHELINEIRDKFYDEEKDKINYEKALE